MSKSGDQPSWRRPMVNFKEPTGTDKERIESFLTNFRDFLDELIREKPNRFFVESLIIPMQNAWKDTRPRFDEVLARLKYADDSILKAHGLTSHELTFKLKIIEYLWECFQTGMIGKVLKRLLKALDILLDSVLAALGLPNPMKEIKDGVDASIAED